MGKIIEMMGFPASYVWSPEGSGSLAPHNSETTKKTHGEIDPMAGSLRWIKIATAS